MIPIHSDESYLIEESSNEGMLIVNNLKEGTSQIVCDGGSAIDYEEAVPDYIDQIIREYYHT